MTGLLDNVRATLASLLPTSQPKPPTITSYGQEASGVSSATIEEVTQWVMLSLFQYEYLGASHLAWLHPDLDVKLNQTFQRLHRRGEPVVGYRCGNQMPSPPHGFYWRLMPEHPSLRVYQLEIKQDE
jgi:hypothetical protein